MISRRVHAVLRPAVQSEVGEDSDPPTSLFNRVFGYDKHGTNFECSRGQAALRPRVSVVCGRLSLRAVPVPPSCIPRTTVPALTAPLKVCATRDYYKIFCFPHPVCICCIPTPPALCVSRSTSRLSTRDSSGNSTVSLVCMASAVPPIKKLGKRKEAVLPPRSCAPRACHYLCEPLSVPFPFASGCCPLTFYYNDKTVAFWFTRGKLLIIFCAFVNFCNPFATECKPPTLPAG